MPNQPKTTARTIRVDDELWADAKAEAEARGLSLSEETRKHLRRLQSAGRKRQEGGEA